MNNTFSIGSTVVLADSVRRVCKAPERYQTGKVVEIGSWNVFEVLWNGFDRPIAMRGDEIVEATT